LSVYLHKASTLVPGTYRVNVGQSSADLPISLTARVS
jgi:hypothetical protein